MYQTYSFSFIGTSSFEEQLLLKRNGYYKNEQKLKIILDAFVALDIFNKVYL